MKKNRETEAFNPYEQPWADDVAKVLIKHGVTPDTRFMFAENVLLGHFLDDIDRAPEKNREELRRAYAALSKSARRAE